MKYIFTFIVLVSAHHFSFSWENKVLPCDDFASLINKTIESINKRDKSAFKSIVKYDMVIRSMEVVINEMEGDTSLMRDMVTLMKNNSNQYYTDLNTIFEFFIETFDEETKSKDWKMQLVDFGPNSKYDNATDETSTLVVNVIVNDKKYQLYSKFFRDNECQHAIVPLEPKIGDQQ